MKSCFAMLIACGLALSAWAPAAVAQLVTRPRPVFPSNFSRTFVSKQSGGFSRPSNYGYFNTGSLNNSWGTGSYSSDYSSAQPFASSGYGLSGYSSNFAPSPIYSGIGLLPAAPGGAVNAPEGTPTLTPGETIHAGSSFPRR